MVTRWGTGVNIVMATRGSRRAFVAMVTGKIGRATRMIACVNGRATVGLQSCIQSIGYKPSYNPLHDNVRGATAAAALRQAPLARGGQIMGDLVFVIQKA